MGSLDKIIAVVGDSIILSSELEAYLFLKINQQNLQPDSLEMNMLRFKTLDELIEGKVLLVHAEKDTNIIITSEEIENEVENRIKYILMQNRISLDEFEKLIQKEQGISLIKFKKEIRQQIRQELLKQKVQQLYVASSRITRSDVDKFFDEYKDSLPAVGESINLSKITINVAPSQEIRQKAYAKIISLKELVDNGEEFGKIAKLHSEGPNAQKGGDLGTISKGTLGELLFEEKIFSLKPGETSDPFETRLGFHIVKIIDRKDQKVHVKQIFVAIKPPLKEMNIAVKTLDSLNSACKTEIDFVEAVKKFSTDEVSKAQKGRLAWQTVNSLKPNTRASFDTLCVGGISKPVTEESNISLYRINDIKKSRTLSLEDDWNEIEQIAQRIHTQKKLIDIVSKWLKETYIDIRL